MLRIYVKIKYNTTYIFDCEYPEDLFYGLRKQFKKQKVVIEKVLTSHHEVDRKYIDWLNQAIVEHTVCPLCVRDIELTQIVF